MSVTLFPHQSEALEETRGKNHVAYYHDMGLGKTFTGSEKMIELGANINLVICQKSKIQDWVDHFKSNYTEYYVLNLTRKQELLYFTYFTIDESQKIIGVINYELGFRRPELAQLTDFTLMLDESSLIQNEKAKRSKFILKLKPANVILLSGTPTGGKYEKLYSQLKLLGMPLDKSTYFNTYIDYHYEDYGGGAKELKVDGYKNVECLKRKMREYGCHFLKTDEVRDLPDQIFTKVRVPASKEYKKFVKDRLIIADGKEFSGDTILTKMLYERLLCGQYSKDKLEAFKNLVESTEDRLIVFYNFTAELRELWQIAIKCNRQVSIVNDDVKSLVAYESDDNSITFIQYKAAAGLIDLQKVNKIIYFSPPLSHELYEQSNHISSSRPCFHYNLTVTDSIEERIYKVLAMRRDYTNDLFEKDHN